MSLNNNIWLRWLNYISYLFNHLYKAGNLKFCRPVVFFHKGEKLEKKEDWLNSISKWLTSFQDGLTGNSIKDNSSKAELFGGI